MKPRLLLPNLRGRTFTPHRLLIAGLLLVAAAPAQYIETQTRTDSYGQCGAPGQRGCNMAPTCTAPSANILRDDYYTQLINCNLPGSDLSPGTQGDVPLPLRLYMNGAVKPSDTFFTTTDLHFGSTTVSDQDHIRHIRYMKQVANQGLHWPAGVGFPDEPINPPAAIITSGDNAHDGQIAELGGYRLLYEPWLTESTNLAVMMGLGNHDVGNDCFKNNCAQRMFDYAAGHVAGGVTSLDPGSHNYSWDWNGVHFLQLNTWAGDTKLGSGSNGTVHPAGLDWLKADLKNSVGVTGRPVVIFQHYGVDGFSTQVNETTQIADWWSADDRRRFLDVIGGYNVVGMFTGHSHATGVNDFLDAQSGKHIDNFVGGTGGQDPCLKNGVKPACGGRGHFYAVRISDPYLDVASLEWRSNVDGSDRPNQPYFTNLAPPVYTESYLDAKNHTINDTGQGPAFVNSQNGCRKLINRQLVDVSDLVTGLSDYGAVTLNNGDPVTIKAKDGTVVPGPVALTFLYPPSDIVNKSFVDRCTAGGLTYLYPDGGPSVDLAPGKSVTFTPKWATPIQGSSTQYVRVFRIVPTTGAVPAALDLNGSKTNLPPDGSIKIYGPANGTFTASVTVQSGTASWISVTATASKFDRFGEATLDYKLNRFAILNDNQPTDLALINVTENATIARTISAALHLRTADKILLTTSRFPWAPIGAAIDFKAVASYSARQVDGGSSLITGTVQLREIKNAGTPNQSVTTIATGYFNNHSDTNPQPTDTVVFPLVVLPAGLHTLQASFAGDAFYEANVSDPVTLSIGYPAVQLATNPPNLKIALDGYNWSTPNETHVEYLTTHTVAAPSPQGTGGVRYVFSSWGDQSTASFRTFKVDQYSYEFRANFNVLYQLTLNQASGGTVTVSSPSGDGYYPEKTTLTFTATPNPGYVFNGFTGDLSGAANTLLLNGPKTVTASFRLANVPVVTWPVPADITIGTPLGPQQLNATASEPGAFVYTPAAGVVLPVGDGQTLSVRFTPTDSTHVAVTTTVKINVKPLQPQLNFNCGVVSRLSYDMISVPISITNTGRGTASGVQVFMAQMNGLAGFPLPYVPSIAPGATVTFSVTFISPTLSLVSSVGNLAVGALLNGQPGRFYAAGSDTWDLLRTECARGSNMPPLAPLLVCALTGVNASRWARTLLTVDVLPPRLWMRAASSYCVRALSDIIFIRLCTSPCPQFAEARQRILEIAFFEE